ncbi:MAG TPA: glycine zipper 2TM domain-containing protein [Paucimonas sp.]|nr:glycine zipper 2TM domain-containing protein [Paucimonas sp.]
MDLKHTTKRIHPLVAGAATSVMLVSLVGTAAIIGILPSSHGSAAPTSSTPALQAAAPAGFAQNPALASGANAPVATAPAEYRAPQPVAHHHHVQHTVTAQAQPVEYAPSRPAPVYQQPAAVAQNSPVGIGVGAVIGGLLGHQVGGGNGRTLATIAGAVGGGYVGNEIAKRNQ